MPEVERKLELSACFQLLMSYCSSDLDENNEHRELHIWWGSYNAKPTGVGLATSVQNWPVLSSDFIEQFEMNNLKFPLLF